METLRGGLLFLVRWLIHYPIVLGTYRVRGWTRAPYLMRKELEGKPGILVANYGNYFYDDILGLMLPPVVPFVFVRDALCRFPLLRPLYRLFRAVPIIRTADPRYTVAQRRKLNDKTFGRVARLLRRGHWLSAFPESAPGHRSSILKPLRPGVAHVALRAEDSSGWGLGLHIYVYGANYENKFAGCSNLYVRWAAPIEVAKYQKLYARNPDEAEEVLMRELEQALHAVVLEAPSLAALADAHRLAYQRNQANFTGVQKALAEVVSGRSSPEDLHRIVCRKGRETLLYQLSGYLLLGVGWVIGWPFRMFGRLCATERSQEMTYQFLLWVLVLITGAIVNESHWAKVQIAGTWLAVTMWLWAWRRGIIEERV